MTSRVVAKPCQGLFGKVAGMVPSRPTRARGTITVRAAKDEVGSRGDFRPDEVVKFLVARRRAGGRLGVGDSPTVLFRFWRIPIGANNDNLVGPECLVGALTLTSGTRIRGIDVACVWHQHSFLTPVDAVV